MRKGLLLLAIALLLWLAQPVLALTIYSNDFSGAVNPPGNTITNWAEVYDNTTKGSFAGDNTICAVSITNTNVASVVENVYSPGYSWGDQSFSFRYISGTVTDAPKIYWGVRSNTGAAQSMGYWFYYPDSGNSIVATAYWAGNTASAFALAANDIIKTTVLATGADTKLIVTVNGTQRLILTNPLTKYNTGTIGIGAGADASKPGYRIFDDFFATDGATPGMFFFQGGTNWR